MFPELKTTSGANAANVLIPVSTWRAFTRNWGRPEHLLGRQGHFRGRRPTIRSVCDPEIKPMGIAAASVSTFGREIEFLPKAGLIWFVTDLINNESRIIHPIAAATANWRSAI
jgi:hypothetical protein